MSTVPTPSPGQTSSSSWVKSSFSTGGQGACVEVRFDGDMVSIRDSKYRRDPANDLTREPVVTVTGGQWQAFCDELLGRADPGASGALAVERAPDGSAVLRSITTGTALTYTLAEWQAFLAGLASGELRQPDLAVTTR